MAASAVGMKQQARGVGKPHGHFVLAPMRQIVYRKFRCVGGLPNIHAAAIVRQVINALRNGSSLCLTGKIMDAEGGSLLTPDLTGIFEVADQLFLLGVY